MANFIDLIYAKSVETQLKNVREELVSTYAELEKISKLKVDFFGGKSAGNVSDMKKLVADFDALTQKSNQQGAAIQKLRTDYNNLNNAKRTTIQYLGQESTSRGSVTKKTREQAIAEGILRVETDRNFRATTNLAGAYAKASAQLLILKKQAKDYAISLGESHPKTLQAIKDANDLAGRIKSADEVVGDFQRNVGNYSNGVTKGIASIFSSVRQLAYILPGIGIAGIFSLALDPLYDLIRGLDIFNDKFKELKDNFDDFRDSQTKFRNESRAIREDFAVLYKIATDSNALPEERNQAVKKLRADYKAFFEQFTDAEIMLGKVGEAVKKINVALNAKAGFENAKQYKEQTEERIDLINQELKSRREFAKESARLNKIIDENSSTIAPATGMATVRSTQILNEVGQAAKNSLSLLSKQRESQKAYLKEKKEENILTKNVQGLQHDLLVLSERKRLTESDIYEFRKKMLALDKEAIKAEHVRVKTRKDIEAINLPSPDADGEALIAWLEKFRAEMVDQQRGVAQNTDTWRAYQKVIDSTTASIKAITDGYPDLHKASKQASDDIDKQIEGTNKRLAGLELLKKKMQEFASSFTSGFFSEAGLTTFFNILDGKVLGFGSNWQVTTIAVLEAAQEMYNLLNKLSSENFDLERQNDERKFAIREKLAAGNEAAIAELEKERERRQKDIARREAKANKELGKINISINAAQGIVGAFKDGNVIKGAIFAALIAGIAAAQIAAINAQSIPQYWKGTENHKGGLMMVNDRGLGRELVQRPDGTSFIPEGKNVILNEPAGTKVKSASMTAKMFGRDLNKILFERNINTGAHTTVNNFEPLIGKLDSVERAITSMPQRTFKLNQNGLGQIIRETTGGIENVNNALKRIPTKFKG